MRTQDLLKLNKKRDIQALDLTVCAFMVALNNAVLETTTGVLYKTWHEFDILSKGLNVSIQKIVTTSSDNKQVFSVHVIIRPLSWKKHEYISMILYPSNEIGWGVLQFSIFNLNMENDLKNRFSGSSFSFRRALHFYDEQNPTQRIIKIMNEN